MRACAALAFVLLLASPAFALPPQQLVVDKILLITEEQELCVSMAFSVDDEEGLGEMLKDGAMLQLSIELSLAKERSFWSNKSIVEHAYVFHLRHDPLTREYMFFPEDNSSPPLRDKNLLRLLNATVRQLNLPLVSLSSLAQEGMGKSYQAKVRITLKHADVPPWLEKSSVFWSSEVLPEYTETLPFQY